MRSFLIKVVCFAAIVGSPLIASSQNYYVVVGAFAANGKASEFRGFLPEQWMDTSYTISEENKQLHFYVLKTSDAESAKLKSLQLRQAIGLLTGDQDTMIGLHPESGISSSAEIGHSVEAPVEVSAEGSSAGSSSAPLAATGAHAPPKPAGKYFKFNVESPEGKPVSAPVHRVDMEKGLELASYNSNTFVDLLTPGDTREPMTLVCGLFGYKEIFKYVDYSDPMRMDGEAYLDESGAWVIPYKLERVEKGDVSPMYNVSFYKDAAIMRKSSKVDLDELVRMMQMNPYYEITIHSHCNGHSKREIVAPGANRNYFDAAGSVRVKGNAKSLTTLRAEAIRAYLMDHGIDPSRIDIFSWGASDMLVKADSPDADINNRIEIEFTRD